MGVSAGGALVGTGFGSGSSVAPGAGANAGRSAFAGAFAGAAGRTSSGLYRLSPIQAEALAVQAAAEKRRLAITRSALAQRTRAASSFA